MSRIIHTDTFTPKASAILLAFKKYTENVGACQMRRNVNLADIRQEPNGEVVWDIDNESLSYRRSTYPNRNDAKVREWLAVYLKNVVCKELKDNYEADGWNRGSSRVVQYLSFGSDKITVAEVYCMYDKLLGRKSFKKTWPDEMVDLIVGEERDPVATELEAARREELKKLESKYHNDCRELEDWRRDELERLRAELNSTYAELNSTYQQKLTMLRNEYDSSYKDLEASMSFIASSCLEI